ncbi:MAG: methyltransferase domain-containing protein [Desulfobacterales bacterium]|nr:methyltransferase domain-containing protein [Desulfobacterales bacterium]
MKPNDNDAPMDPLFDILVGPVKMAVLEAALNLKIADILEQGMTVQAVARALDIRTDTQALGAFLDSMTALGFLEKQSGIYRDTRFALRYLHSKSPLYMNTFISRMKGMQHKNLDRITDIVKNGPPDIKKNEVLASEVKWENAVSHLAAYQRAGMARRAADLVQALPEFKDAQTLLDLGGGPGLMGAEMVRRHPTLKGVLLDQAAIVRLAEKEIEKEGLAQRISFIPGDYNETDFGSGYDIVWASHNLYYVREPQNFYTRLRHALSNNGVVICLHEGLTFERTRPAGIVLSRLSLALEGQDVSFEQGKIAGYLKEAGFARVESRTVNLGVDEWELVTARKKV